MAGLIYHEPLPAWNRPEMKDLQRLDPDLLKALDALLDERSVTRAAQRLGVSQPALSAMLTRLRDSFKDELFVRASRGIVATTRAVELAGPLKSVIQHAAALLQPTGFDPAQTGRHFTLAATDYAFHAIAVPLAVRHQATGTATQAESGAPAGLPVVSPAGTRRA